MKKLITVLFCLPLIFSCNHKKTVELQKQEEMRIYFTERIRKTDSTVKIDSFRFVSMDTITLQGQYRFLSGEILDEINLKNEELGLQVSKAKDSKQLAQLSSGSGATLFNYYKENFEDDKKKMLELKTEDSLLIVDMNKIDSLTTKADSIKPVAFMANCLFQIRRKDMSIDKDTTRIILSKEMNIMSIEDYKRSIGKIFFPQSAFDITK